jgi:2-oxoisovalerate dehydrogenase E2 component (dihydrolipoyl transacylase)
VLQSLEIPHFGYVPCLLPTLHVLILFSTFHRYSTSLDLTALHDILPILGSNIPHYYLPGSLQPGTQFVNPASLYPVPTRSIPETARFTKLTYLPILIKMLSKAMMEWPVFRSSITPGSASGKDGSKPTLTIRPNADITLALSTPTGLYAPTITSANNHSVFSITSQLKQLSHLGRQVPSALTTKEMPRKGGTLTVSNVGAIGKGEWAQPVLVEGGGVAIVAIGRAEWKWEVGDDVKTPGGERRLKMGVSWSADHRVVEGAELAAFVECWRGWVEKPERLIGEGV